MAALLLDNGMSRDESILTLLARGIFLGSDFTKVRRSSSAKCVRCSATATAALVLTSRRPNTRPESHCVTPTMLSVSGYSSFVVQVAAGSIEPSQTCVYPAVPHRLGTIGRCCVSRSGANRAGGARHLV